MIYFKWAVKRNKIIISMLNAGVTSSSMRKRAGQSLGPLGDRIYSLYTESLHSKAKVWVPSLESKSSKNLILFLSKNCTL